MVPRSSAAPPGAHPDAVVEEDSVRAFLAADGALMGPFSVVGMCREVGKVFVPECGFARTKGGWMGQNASWDAPLPA